MSDAAKQLSMGDGCIYKDEKWTIKNAAWIGNTVMALLLQHDDGREELARLNDLHPLTPEPPKLGKVWVLVKGDERMAFHTDRTNEKWITENVEPQGYTVTLIDLDALDPYKKLCEAGYRIWECEGRFYWAVAPRGTAEGSESTYDLTLEAAQRHKEQSDAKT